MRVASSSIFGYEAICFCLAFLDTFIKDLVGQFLNFCIHIWLHLFVCSYGDRRVVLFVRPDKDKHFFKKESDNFPLL